MRAKWAWLRLLHHEKSAFCPGDLFTGLAGVGELAGYLLLSGDDTTFMIPNLVNTFSLDFGWVIRRGEN
jgi:hypothetical protein